MDLKDFIKNNWNNFFDSRDEADAFYKRIGVLDFLLLDRIYKEYYKKQCDIPDVSQQRELFKGFLEKVVEETYSGDLTWQTRDEAKELLKLFYSKYLIYGEDILR